MEMSTHYLPEELFPDQSYTMEDLKKAKEENKTVSVLVTRYVDTEGILEVFVPGIGKSGKIPIDQFSIYPLYKKNGDYATALYSLIGKRVSCKIIDVDSDTLLFSRKLNMSEALEEIRLKKYLPYVYVTGVCKSDLFVDVGAGLVGRINVVNFSTTRFYSLKDLGATKGMVIPAKILSYDKLNRFNLSYKATCMKKLKNYSEGDIVCCKVSRSLDDNSGFFVYINPIVSGIMDSPISLPYGSDVVGIIHKVTPKGLRLNFLSFR